MTDLSAELALDLFLGHLAVFNDIVKQPGRERLLIHLQVGEDLGDLNRVDYVRLAVLSFLGTMFLFGEIKGASDQIRIRLRSILLQPGEDTLQRLARSLHRIDLRAASERVTLFRGRPFEGGFEAALDHEVINIPRSAAKRKVIAWRVGCPCCPWLPSRT